MKRDEFLKLAFLTAVGLGINPQSSPGSPFAPDFSSDNAKYYTSKDQEYDSLRAGFNARIHKMPAVIAVCANTKGVQEAVMYAIKYRLAVSVKSGGHCMEGFSCGNGSMQIILSSMNKIAWLDDYRISIGPGCTLSHVYEELIPKNRILPGGSCAGVGIAGLSLGGGYGLMSRLFGLTCDSLEEVTMVDGKGRIVSSKSDRELLWGCKGGNNGNFGVITDMVFKVHNRPKIMSSYRFRSFKVNVVRGTSILKTWFEESRKLPNACFSSCLFNGETAYVLLTNVSKLTPAVQHFVDVMKSLSDKTTSNYEEPLANALKNYYGRQHPLMFKNASAGLYRSYAELEPMIAEILGIVFASRGMIYQFNTLGGAIQSPEFEAESSFPHREYSFFTELQTYWEQPVQGERLVQRFEEIQQIVAKHGGTAQYANYPDIKLQHYETSYYGKNLGRLRELKKRFDPDNLIRHEQSIRL